MDKSTIRRIAVFDNERPREIEIYINWYTERYGRTATYEEIAYFLCVTMETVASDIDIMRGNGFQFTGQAYRRIA